MLLLHKYNISKIHHDQYRNNINYKINTAIATDLATEGIYYSKDLLKSSFFSLGSFLDLIVPFLYATGILSNDIPQLLFLLLHQIWTALTIKSKVYFFSVVFNVTFAKINKPWTAPHIIRFCFLCLVTQFTCDVSVVTVRLTVVRSAFSLSQAS